MGLAKIFLSNGHMKTSTPVFGTAVYPYMPYCNRRQSHPLTARARRQWRGLASIGNTCRRAPICPILGFWGTKVPQNGRFLAKNALEPPTKFDAASFIIAGEIRNRTNKKYKQTKNKYCQWRGLTVIHICRSYVYSPRADSSDFGLLGVQSSPKWEIPCEGRPWTAVQYFTPLDLSWSEKSVTVQTNKNKQTLNDISTPCLSVCVDNKRTWQTEDIHRAERKR